MTDYQELINRTQRLIGEKTHTGFKNERPEGFPPRHYLLPVSVFRIPNGINSQFIKNNYCVINLYKPTREGLKAYLIEIDGELYPQVDCLVLLHSHKPLHECKPDDLCHEYGFEPPVSQTTLWRLKWGYLYPSTHTNNNTVNLEGIDFTL